MSARHIPRPTPIDVLARQEPLRLYLARRYDPQYLLDRAELYAHRCHQLAIKISRTTRERKIRRLVEKYRVQEWHLNYWLAIRQQQLGRPTSTDGA